MSISQTLFKFDGKLARGNFALFMVPLMLINLFLNVVLSAVEKSSAGLAQEAAMMILIWVAVSIYVGAALSIKRFHDLNKSGWNYLWLFVPIISLYFLFILFFKKNEN